MSAGYTAQCCDYSDDLENMEHIYKYYMHHGVSVHLVAYRDEVSVELGSQYDRLPQCDQAPDPLWTVRLNNLYTPGQPQGCRTVPQCPSPKCNGADCIWACTSGIHTAAPYGSEYPNTRREKNVGVRMSTLELRKLMDLLECGRLHTGQIILE